MSPDERRLMDAHRGFSQRERTVRLLTLGGWFSITEIHRVVGFCRLNSRVAEARKVFRRDGHPFDIVHSIRDGEHGYELVPLAEGTEVGGVEGSCAKPRAQAETPRTDSSGQEVGLTAPVSSASGSNLSSQADPDSHGEDGPLVVPPRPTPDEYASLPVLPPEILEGQGQLL